MLNTGKCILTEYPHICPYNSLPGIFKLILRHLTNFLVSIHETLPAFSQNTCSGVWAALGLADAFFETFINHCA